MSAPIAFSALITSVQLRANIDSQAGPVTLPEIREYLNEGLAEYWDLLVPGRGQEHIRKANTFNTVAGTAAYPLPVDFYELISVDVRIAPNQYLTATPYMESERNAFRLYPAWAGWFMSMPVFYRIQGSVANANVASITEKTINFIPGPQGAYPITLNYIYRLPVFNVTGTDDAKVIDSVNNWTDFAVWNAVANVKNRLKEDPSFALARVENLRSRIEALAPQNDAGNAERIRDVEADYDSTSWWGG